MREKILFIKHIATEGPGLLGAFFEHMGFELEILELYAGDPLPDDVRRYAAIVSLGGPMNVYQEEDYSFLKKENVFIKTVLFSDVPFLGICLGSQLLAKACAIKVIKSPAPEIGFFDVSLTSLGAQDPLFKGIDKSFKVFQWHEDMSLITDSAMWLAESKGCPYQAFRVGEKAYGFQFHLEADRSMMGSWMNAYWKAEGGEMSLRAKKIFAQHEEIREPMDRTARQIYRNFLSLIE